MNFNGIVRCWLDHIVGEVNIADIHQCLTRSFAFLADLRYSGPSFGESSTELTGWIASASYERPDIDRRVKVSVSGPREDGKLPMLVRISKGREGFYLTHWLQQVQKTDKPCFAEPCTSEEEMHAAIQKMGKEAEAIMTSSVAEVLLGETWPHVVFDWGDYK